MAPDELLAIRSDDQGLYVEVPDGWQQGRGAFGGLSFAWLVRAAVAAEPDAERRPRAMSLQLCGPVRPGRARLGVEALRVGNGVSHRLVRLVQGDEAPSVGIVTLGRARGEAAWCGLEAPTVTPWRELPVVPTVPQMPTFARHMEFRFAYGDPPWSRSATGVSGAWVRRRERAGPRDAAEIALLLDALWPSAIVRAEGPRPVATIAASVQWFDDGGDPDAPALLVVRSDAAREGYTLEDRVLWADDGRLLATCRQTIAVLA